jgi:hypothetical protein
MCGVKEPVPEKSSKSGRYGWKGLTEPRKGASAIQAGHVSQESIDC